MVYGLQPTHLRAITYQEARIFSTLAPAPGWLTHKSRLQKIQAYTLTEAGHLGSCHVLEPQKYERLTWSGAE